MRIEPTVGRVVLVYLGGERQKATNQPNAGIIAFVHPSGKLVNLTVCDHYGAPFGAMNVPLIQAGDPMPPNNERFCEWMPYQLGQAERTKLAEAASSIRAMSGESTVAPGANPGTPAP